MQQKVKLSILVMLTSISILAILEYEIKKTPIAEGPLNSTAKQSEIPKAAAKPQQIQSNNTKNTVEGKIRSIGEKQLYIELADGKGAAINISATVPVLTEGNVATSNLSILKKDDMVIIKIDEKNNATEILIKK